MHTFFGIILALLSPFYIAYVYKKFKKSNDKRQFFHSPFFLINYWIFGMALFSIILVNVAFPKNYSNDNNMGSYLADEIDSLSNIIDQGSLDLDSNVSCIVSYFELIDDKPIWDLKNEGVLNVYRHMYESQSEDSINTGKVCMSLIKLILFDNDSSRYFIEHDFNAKLKYSNFILGMINLKQGEKVEAMSFFEREAHLPNGYKDKSYEFLIDYYHSEKNYDKLNEIFFDPLSREYIDTYLSMELNFLNGSYFFYYKDIIRVLIPRANVVGVIAAFLIMMVWLYYMKSINLFDKLPNWKLLVVLIASMLFIFLVFPISDYNQLVLGNELNGGYWNDFKYSVFGIGLIEEIVKILPLILILSFTKWVKEPFHYILFACVSAIGFAMVENIMYFQKHYTTIIHARSLTSAAGHMIFSSIFAYGLILVKYKIKKSIFYVPVFLLFWLVASLSHGLYDYWLFVELRFFFYLFFFISIGTWSKMINNTINNSSAFNVNVTYDSARIQMKIVLALAGILFFEYMSVGEKYGSGTANDSLVHSVINGSLVLFLLGSKLSSLDIVKGYWRSFNLSLNPFSNQVLTQNFVNKDILIRSLPTNDALAYLMPDDVKGKIIDRLVLHKSKKYSTKIVSDPYWFLVKLDSPVPFIDSDHDYVLIKLKEGFESLDEGRNFWAMVIAIPEIDMLKEKKLFLNKFILYGWTFINEGDK